MASRPVLSVNKQPTPPADEREKLRDYADKRYSSMMSTRSGQEQPWYEIAGLCMPSRSVQLVEVNRVKNRDASRSSSLYDGHSIRAMEICANGMLSGLSSRHQPWFRLTLADKALMNYYPVRLWLDDAEKAMYAALALSNFYEAALSCYLEMAAFGTAACVMQEHRDKVLTFHAMTAGEYAITVGEDLLPDSLGRSYQLSCRQIVERYLADSRDSSVVHWDRATEAVKTAWNSGNYERLFTVRQLIEPNAAYLPGKLGAAGKKWRSMKWEPGQHEKAKLLDLDGYHEQSFFAPRWETIAGEIYGTGRGHKALPDMRALQLQAKRKGQATDMAVKPPTMGPPGIDRVQMLPGRHTTVAGVDMAQGIKPIYEIPYQVLSVVGEDVKDARQAIDRMAFVDLFMAITTMDGVQPRTVEEIVRRHEEQLTQLGGAIDRANGEMLQVVIDRVFGILTRGNMLPPAPPEIEGVDLRIDFVSVLAQAQKMLGIGGVERTLGFTGNLAGMLPEVVDNIDGDAVLRDYWERSGAPVIGLRDPKVRDQMRADRAKQQQAEKLAEAMPAVQQGADAARLLSETDTGNGGNLLQQLMPQ